MKTIDAYTRIQLRNILFATDFSAAAQAAIPYAAGLTRHFGATLYAIHVRPMAVGPLMAPDAEHGAAEAARIDAEQQRKHILDSFPEMRPDVLIEDGDVWARIEGAIASRDIDLVVTGTRGRSGVAMFLLGSVAEKILRKANCPVLTVGPHSRAGTQPGEIKTILLAADLNPRSTAAPYAVSLAQEYQARLVLLRVTAFGEVADLPRSADLLRFLVPPDAELWCNPEYIVEPGEIADTILSVAAQREADLIVMGARHPSELPGASTHLPTTAQRVISQAQCPVLTVRA